jgi:hypothetical protein
MRNSWISDKTFTGSWKSFSAKYWTVLLLTVAAALLAYTTAGAHAANTSELEKMLTTLDQKRVDAQVRGDFGVLESILGEDLTYVHASGAVQNKAEFLADLTSGKRVYKSVKSSDLHVRILGRVAVITGQSKIIVINDAKEHELSLRVTEVYADRNKHWQMVAYQSTRLTP